MENSQRKIENIRLKHTWGARKEAPLPLIDPLPNPLPPPFRPCFTSGLEWIFPVSCATKG